MTIGFMKTIIGSKDTALFAWRDDLESPGGFQGVIETGNEACPVSGVRFLRARPCSLTDDKTCIWKQELGLTVAGPSAQQTSGVVEVEVTEDHHINLFMSEAHGSQILKEHMVFFIDPEPFSECRWEEGSDSSFQQY